MKDVFSLGGPSQEGGKQRKDRPGKRPVRQHRQSCAESNSADKQRNSGVRSMGGHGCCWVSPSGDVEEHQDTMYIFRHVVKDKPCQRIGNYDFDDNDSKMTGGGIPYRHT